MSTTTPDGPKALAAALARIPSGLFILTVRRGADETAMLASWVQQCSFDPPQVTAAVNKDRYFHDWFMEGTAFAVNVLAEGQTHLVKHFGHGFAPGKPPFTGLDVSQAGESATVLKETHAYLDCRVTKQIDVGDHVLVVGKVIGGAVQHEAKPATHVRKNGMIY